MGMAQCADLYGDTVHTHSLTARLSTQSLRSTVSAIQAHRCLTTALSTHSDQQQSTISHRKYL